MNTLSNKPRIGLVLPGGGARAAYHVGVLKAIAEFMPRRAPNPFPVISGTSAGAINAAVLASRALRFRAGIAEMERVWANFSAQQVYRSDAWTMLASSAHWFVTVLLGGFGVRKPRSLLDNAPLRELLGRKIRFEEIQRAIDARHLDAVAITASGYNSARSISFFQAREGLKTWTRVRRRGQKANLTLDHLMASVAVPFIFPPTCIDGEFYGDGAMRQATPLSAAIHLGAQRLLVIGVRDEASNPTPDPANPAPYPSLGQIAGYMLDTLFMDGLYADLERVTRINLLLSQTPPGRLSGPVANLKRIDTMLIVPSQDIRGIARRHVHELPIPVRLLLKGLGAMNQGGLQLVSYLLFESGYTRALIRLGYRDAWAVADRLRPFLAGEEVPPISAPHWVERDLSGEEKRPEAEERQEADRIGHHDEDDTARQRRVDL
ncbi:MAG: patatin-like phospholipase family protein [Gammaproteobacteria bacterium]